MNAGVGIGNVSSDQRVAALRVHLIQALNDYKAATGDTSCWPFTIDAVVFLCEWLSQARPKETRVFLELVAQRGTDDDLQAIVERTQLILDARIALMKELTDFRRFS